MMMKMWSNWALKFVLVLFMFVFLSVSISAQDNSCPADFALSLPRANAACAGTERNEVCFGNGNPEITVRDDAELTFATAGDRVDAAQVEILRHGGDQSQTLDVSVLQLQANLAETQAGRNTTIVLFGDTAIVNLVEPLPQLTFTTIGTVNIRDLPESGADIIYRMALRETLPVNGRTDDNRWLRVDLPDRQQVGWVAADAATNLTGAISELVEVDATTPVYRPFQVMRVQTWGDGAPCAGAPQSGVLIQTPNDITPVNLVINGAEVRLTATVFIQAQLGGFLTVDVLDGVAAISAFDVQQIIPAGTRTYLPLTDALEVGRSPELPEPYALESLASLPVNMLPYRFAIPEPLTQAEIEATLAAMAEEAQQSPVMQTNNDEDICQRQVARDTSLNAGPGQFYETTRQISGGVRVTPVLEVNDPDGRAWWQLNSGNWILVNDVRVTGPCGDVPVVTAFAPPVYNSLSIEECVANNGPIREGQSVELEFVYGSWETYREALSSSQIDPGEITINGVSIGYIYASRPFLVSDRYYRYFRGNWTAQSGSFRIVGERLSYRVTCNVTVPVG